MATHVVSNQPRPLDGYNVFSSDRALVEGLAREAPAAPVDEIMHAGERAGSADVIALGFEANEHPPELRTHDRFGNRIDEVQPDTDCTARLGWKTNPSLTSPVRPNFSYGRKWNRDTVALYP